MRVPSKVPERNFFSVNAKYCTLLQELASDIIDVTTHCQAIGAELFPDDYSDSEHRDHVYRRQW